MYVHVIAKWLLLWLISHSHLGFIQTYLYIAQVNHWTASILSLGVLAPHESKYLFQLHK